MRVSLKATYGIMASIDLAIQNGNVPIQSKAIARRQGIPVRFLEQVLHADAFYGDSILHQLEALVVDENVTMVDLKSTIMQFVHAYFGKETKVRFRPSFFPFTEPSAEVDVYLEDKQRWVELGGCGMVHPNVFKACGIDPEKYTGGAFGFGIERIAMRKYAINDIRYFVENDIRFLKQF